MEKRVYLRIVESPPIPPEFGPIELFGDFLQVSPEPLGVGRDSKVVVRLQCDDWRDDPHKILILYGIVKYRDVFNPERETRFGYAIKGENLLRIAGRDEYWRHYQLGASSTSLASNCFALWKYEFCSIEKLIDATGKFKCVLF